MSEFHLSRVLIVGVGLMGSSLARALHERKLADTIIGMDENGDNLRIGQTQGWLTEIAPSERAPEPVDMVIFCTPPHALASSVRAALPFINDQTAITDVASVKRIALEVMKQQLPYPHNYVPAHPIAGSTASGAALGKANLYEHRQVMLCPEIGVDINDPSYLRVRQMWESVGATIALMPADVHDLVYAHVSHLPQLVGFVAHHILAPVLTPSQLEGDEILQRFMRLGHSPAPLWNSIFSHNADYVLQALQMYLAYAEQIVDEFSQAPADAAKDAAPSDELLTRLFPRIVASCLVASLSQLEHRAKLKLASFAGAGFADMACPALETPEADIEKISGQVVYLIPYLQQLIAELRTLTTMLEQQQTTLFAERIEQLAA